ncbi:hypothetical protein DFH06DRAFT_617633 [Mycena polygramma]|nr:hypothetical protein DFH06DRAFT_617633 [Mycena polygramma]
MQGMAMDQTLGMLLVGTWIASVLCGIVLVEAFKYFALFPNDSWKRKGLVLLLLTLCVAAMIGEYGTTYYPTVTYWGELEVLGKIFWTLPLESFANSISGIIVDCYLIYRFYMLSKNIWATLFLCALLLVALGGYFIVFFLLVTRQIIKYQSMETKGAIIYSIAQAVVDVLIAVGLIWKLRSMKSSFKRTNTFLNRVMVGALRTGSITALCAILVLAIFLHNKSSVLSTLFSFQLAPLYTLTLLFNFNLRRKYVQPLTIPKTSEIGNGIFNTTLLLSGIHIHRTAIVAMDPIDHIVDTDRHRLALEEAKQRRQNNSRSPNSFDEESLGTRDSVVEN